MRLFLIAALILSAASCNKIVFTLKKTSKVSGTVVPLVGLVSSIDRSGFSAYAATCEATVSLYAIGHDRNLIRPAIAQADVQPNGTYTLNVKDSVLSNATVDHLLEVESQGTCEQLLRT